MKQHWNRAASVLCIAALLLCGCAQQPSGAQSASEGAASQTPAVETQRVAGINEQYKDVLSNFSVIGEFHDGVAFAGIYRRPSVSYDPDASAESEKESYEAGSDIPVECGYVTLDGTFTPLYTVPSEAALFGSAEGGIRNFSDAHVAAFFLESMEGQALYMGLPDEMLAESETVPYVSEQTLLDSIFSVNDSGLVPYFADGKWGFSDVAGNLKIEPAYAYVLGFDGGVALVQDVAEEPWKVIDTTGSAIFAFDTTIRPKRARDCPLIVSEGKLYNAEMPHPKGEVHRTITNFAQYSGANERRFRYSRLAEGLRPKAILLLL